MKANCEINEKFLKIICGGVLGCTDCYVLVKFGALGRRDTSSIVNNNEGVTWFDPQYFPVAIDSIPNPNKTPLLTVVNRGALPDGIAHINMTTHK